MRIIEAITRFRAGGYDERLGFTVYDTLRYKQALEPLVAEEVEVLTQRLAGDLDPDRAVEIVEAGAQPLNDLIAALHTKLLVAELERHRASCALSHRARREAGRDRTAQLIRSLGDAAVVRSPPTSAVCGCVPSVCRTAAWISPASFAPSAGWVGVATIRTTTSSRSSSSSAMCGA